MTMSEFKTPTPMHSDEDNAKKKVSLEPIDEVDEIDGSDLDRLSGGCEVMSNLSIPCTAPVLDDARRVTQARVRGRPVSA